LIKNIVLLKGTKKVGRRTKSFGGKIVLRKKKVCAFEWCHVLSQKYTSPLAGKILPCATDFSHQKSKYMLDFWLDSVQKCRLFFFILATLHS